MTRSTELLTGNEIDRILSRRDEILPSSGFAASVMEAIRQESAVPPPLPFPWKRALPGIAIGGLGMAFVVIACVVVLVRVGTQPGTAQPSYSTFSLWASAFHGGIQAAAIWTFLSLLAALVSVKLSTRLAFGGD
jgi:hypothetical protein